jgi:hypothetical protein
MPTTVSSKTRQRLVQEIIDRRWLMNARVAEKDYNNAAIHDATLWGLRTAANLTGLLTLHQSRKLMDYVDTLIIDDGGAPIAPPLEEILDLNAYR